MKVVIDGHMVNSERSLHECLKKALNLGDYYGQNYQALEDRLKHDVERPVVLSWENSHKSRVALGDEVFSRYLDLFRQIESQDAEYGWGERFEFICN